jgi:hypothetical protein
LPVKDFRIESPIVSEVAGALRPISGESVFRLESSGNLLGTATPVDKRGYFVTAAHCLPEGGAVLVVGRDQKPAEVVRQWTDEGQDTALFHSRVSLEGQCIFEQRETKIRDGERITIAGMIRHGRHDRMHLWQGAVDMKGSDDMMLHVYMNPRKRLPNSERGACGGPAIDRRGSLVGILVGVLAKRIPIGEILDPKRQRKLTRNLSKAYAKTILKTRFGCKRCEVSPIRPILGQLERAINDHVREMAWKRAEEIRASRE